ncbi:MAG: TonB-dependent receptor [Asticcacaulis sp.]
MKDSKRTRGLPRTYGRNVSAAAMLCGVSAVALSAFAMPAFAQDTTAVEEVEEVIVTGIRRSLQSAQTLKQNSDVIVDSVTAEDIGALPDRSVTEALQRIPGVSINRFAAGVDPDHFSVEGSGVTVRGLNMTRSELNGRDAFTANNGRALGFADVPSELMAGVDVFKNPSADRIEGGIAGTVNLRTRVPFDSRGQTIAFSVEGSYGDFAEEWTPTGSVLYSNRWETEYGEFGLLFNLVHSKLKTRSDGIQITDFACRYNSTGTYNQFGITTQSHPTAYTNSGVACTDAVANNGTTQAGVYFPRGMAMRSSEHDRTREGQAFAAQWRSTDDTMLATFQFLRSEATQAWTEHAIEVASDNVRDTGPVGNQQPTGDARPVWGSDVTFDDSGIFTSGVITSQTLGWSADHDANSRRPAYGLQSNNIRRDERTTNITKDFGFNFRWTPNDKWGVNLDLQRAESTVDAVSTGLWASTWQDVAITLNGKDLPDVEFRKPTQINPHNGATPGGTNVYLQGANADYSDPYNNFWRAAMDHIEQSEGWENAARLDVEYKFDDNNWVNAIQFGVRWAERDQTTRFSAYNWGVISERWGSMLYMDEPARNNPNGTAHNAQAFGFDNFMQGDMANPLVTTPPLFYVGSNDYQAYADFVEDLSYEWRSHPDRNFACGQGWVSLFNRCDTVAATPFLPSEINPMNEVNKAWYGMVKYRHDFDNGMKLSGNIGLRYTETDRTASGFMKFPLGNFTPEADCLNPTHSAYSSAWCQLVSPATRDQARDWANGAVIQNDEAVSYRYLLPSFNARLEARPGLVFRLGLSETLNNPDLGLLRNYYNLGLSNTVIVDGAPTGNVTVGNPRLKPAHSQNIDLSAEWYFAPVGSVTLALFHKELKDVISNSTERRTFVNPDNGYGFDVVVTQPGNSSQKAKIKGYEIAYQQTYDFLPSPFDGLGVNANYSYIDSTNVPQSTLSATDPDVAAGRVAVVDTSLLPLQGLSKHNANVAVFYEKYGLSARLAYNWRDDFLITVRDVITPFQPIMQEASGQLDGSIFYNVTPKIKIGLQGVNLTNEIVHTRAVLNDKLQTAPRSWFMNDRRVTFVIRGTF